METSQLPDKAAKVLREIRKKYKTALEALTINGHTIQLLQVTDLEPLLAGKDPFGNVSEFPFWVKLWEAAIVLSNAVADLAPKPGETLLELGAGLGAPGLVAAVRGFKVTLSDYEPHILDFQRVSAAANGLKGVEHKIIDWTNPPELIQFDVIIGAEIIFREDLFQPLLHVFNKYLAPGGVIYLAHDQRRKSLYKFMELAGDAYRILGKKVDIASDDKNQSIILNKLERK
jgi:predicted nicotinamide N-methyase